MTTKHDEIIIKVEKREVTGKQVSKMRRQGITPGVVYGHKVDSYPVQMETHATTLLMKKIAHHAGHTRSWRQKDQGHCPRSQL